MRFFKRPEPTGREPVIDHDPATREELAELGRQFATPQPAQARTIRRSQLFRTEPNYEDGAHGPGVIV